MSNISKYVNVKNAIFLGVGIMGVMAIRHFMRKKSMRYAVLDAISTTNVTAGDVSKDIFALKGLDETFRGSYGDAGLTKEVNILISLSPKIGNTDEQGIVNRIAMYKGNQRFLASVAWKYRQIRGESLKDMIKRDFQTKEEKQLLYNAILGK